MDSNPKFQKINLDRRGFLKAALIASAVPWALSACNPRTSTSTYGSSATSDVIKIGFIPLTDCASVVMADKLGLYEKHGVKVEVTKESSWANVRDKLLT